jgi:hypothetical protein
MIAYFAYPVMRGALQLCMERRSVSIDLFSGLVFSGFSLKSLKALCSGKRIVGKTLSKHKRMENDMIRWVRFGLLVVTCYILAFSTFVSAMTGYATTFEPYFTDPNNTNSLISVASLDLPPLFVADSNFNMTESYPIYQDSADFATGIACESFNVGISFATRH